jgi:hypothetical protein
MKNKTSKKDGILWREVSHYDFFAAEIQYIHVRFDIKPGQDGLINLSDSRRYLEAIKALAEKCMKELGRNHKITTDPFPLTLDLLIQSYIENGSERVEKIINEGLNPFGAGIITDISKLTPEQIRYHAGKVVIVIEPHASRDDVLYFVTRQWKAMSHFKEKVPRIKTRSVAEEHDIIRGLCKLSKAKLCEKFNLRSSEISGKTKYEIIAKQMDVKIGPKMVEKICAGTRKTKQESG